MKPRKIKNQHRQGDVALDPCKLPKGAKEVRRGRCVLALGESTGHAHEVLDAIMYEHKGKFYLKVETPTEFVHTKSRVGRELSVDHGVHKLPPGDYEVVRQHEKLGDVWRQVSD